MSTARGAVRAGPRLRRLGPSAALALLAACAAGGPGTPVPDHPSGGATADPVVARPVDRVLAASAVESVIDARAAAFTRRIALLAGDLTDPELERLVPAVRAAFAPELLRADIAAFMEAEAVPGRMEEVATWLEDGAAGDARRTVDAYEPPLALREWLTEYTSQPPSPERIRLVAGWTDARGMGDFFVLLEQALSESAYAVRAVFRPDAGAFTPLGGDALIDRLENSFSAAVVTALHGAETVPDSVLAEATREYRSEAGQWYVRTYQLAVAEAVRTAGRRVVDALSG